MKSLVEIIHNSIMDVCIEPVVENGIFDPRNNEHVFCLIEKLEEKKLTEDIICEAIAAIRQEGKYPERQAYNKEGWLVTFPSPEYKNAAIKKGTHFASDPTHGKGGMNVYYKRRGKQKRMGQQDPSQVEPAQQPAQPSAPPEAQQAPKGNPNQQSSPTDDSGGSGLPKSGDDSGDDAPIDFKSQYDKDPDSLPKSDSAPEGSPQSGAGGNAPSNSGGDQQPSPPPAPVAPPAPSFVNISVEFAKGKQWNPTPFGEWRNVTGDATAIVALSGEVVPIKTTDREELKLFAAKRQP
jgi:hypothetical protein